LAEALDRDRSERRPGLGAISSHVNGLVSHYWVRRRVMEPSALATEEHTPLRKASSTNLGHTGRTCQIYGSFFT